jgi:hypothetical protein
MEEAIKSDIWEHALLESLKELATGMLFLSEPELIKVTDSIPPSIKGAQVAMVSMQECLNIGLSSDREGCALLSRSLLGMEPDEELAPEDIQDAMGEIVNIVAGGVKRKLIEEIPTLKIGLPIFFEGKMSPNKGASSKFMEIKIDSVTVKLFIMLEGEC